ncbi:hypothetical protein [Bacterioplanoides sp.]|uniref:hypothetical protein n=1 Tax=Bacterioplanoides sp. TaxID=2066072 RepID=UPI003B5C6DDB
MALLKTLSPVSTFDEVASQLEQLGLTQHVFESAIQAGLYMYKRTTHFHPVTTAGSRFWEEAVAGLREELVSPEDSSWQFKHEKGLSITMHPESGISIVVTTGNRFTGISEPTGKVKTKNAKGSSTLDYVGRNSTPDLFLDEEPTFDIKTQDLIKSDPNETWVFLYYINKQKHEIRSELSLPKGMHQSEGKLTIDEWEKRIILPPIDYSGTISEKMPITPDNHFSEDFDFNSLIKNE